MTAKVSVCIPVYGVEKYIEQCVRTLFGQTLREIEYVFVDDCSPDKSIEIMQRVLEEFPERKAWVKLIRHETNKGVGAARNYAVAACTGEYVIHCDPDDWVELDMYEKMYNKAKETDADMVYCSYVREYPHGSKINCNEPFYNNHIELLNQMYTGKCQGYLFNKLYKKKIALHESIKCPNDIVMCEDLLRNTFMLPLCKKTVAVPNHFYHYRFVECSISNSNEMSRQLKKLESMIKFTSIVEEKDLVTEHYLNFSKSFILHYALSTGIEHSYYKNIFPNFQANLNNINLRLDRKLPLIIATHNIWIARYFDAFLVRIKQIIRNIWMAKYFMLVIVFLI